MFWKISCASNCLIPDCASMHPLRAPAGKTRALLGGVCFGLAVCIAGPLWSQTGTSIEITRDGSDPSLAGQGDVVFTHLDFGGIAPAPTGDTSLRFEPNAGQLAEPVEYFARGRGYEVALHDGGAIVSLYNGDGSERPIASEPARRGQAGKPERAAPRQLTVRRFGMTFVGMNDSAEPQGRHKQASRTNYLIGEDQADWHTDIANYARVRYAQAYDGIDLVFRGDQGRIRHDFIVAPGADPDQIEVRYRGADHLTVTEAGDLVLDLGEQDLIQNAPVAFQQGSDGTRERVEAQYAIEGDTVRFELGEYDSDRQLVIDPTLEYSSYFGGSGNDGPAGLDVDADGNIYVFMATESPGLATAGAFQETRGAIRTVDSETLNCPDCTDSNDSGFVERTTIAGTFSILVSKFSADGTTLIWSTYVSSDQGGTGRGIGTNSVAVTPGGEAAFGMPRLLGPGLPLVNETQGFPAAGAADYIAKLNNSGDDLVFATYLQSGSTGFLRGLDVSSAGQIAAAGWADQDHSLPVANPLAGQSCPDSGGFQRDIYIVRFQSGGTLDFLSCLAGDRTGEQGRGIEYGDDGLVYVLGRTNSTDFPTTPDAIQPDLSSPGATDMAISVIDPDLSTLEYSTYLGPDQPGHATIIDFTGGPGNNSQPAFFPIDIGVDAMGKIYVTGVTNLLHYPTTDNALKVNLNHPLTSYTGEEFTSPTWDIYVTKLDRFNAVLDYSTYLGGANSEDGLHAMQVDGAGNAYILTVTDSDDYPTAAAIQDTLMGQTSIAVTRLAPSGALSWSTYLGTANDTVNQIPGGLALRDDDLVFASSTLSDAWPVTPDAFQGALAGERDTTINILDTSGDTDSDGDGVIDPADAFPADAAEWRDTDGNGTGNVADTDDDGDGTDDSADAFPLIPSEQVDSDGDGVGDNLDQFPGDALAAFDFDGDGTADFADDDMDNDGAANAEDVFKLAPGAQLDCDNDGGEPFPDPAMADAFDPDDDNDGVPDAEDIAPFDDNRPIRTFEAFDPSITQVFKSPLPAGFEMVAGADGAWTAAGDRAFGGDGSLSSYDVMTCGTPQSLDVINDATESGLGEYVDIEEAEIIGVDGCGLDFRFQLRGDLLNEGDPMLDGVLYRVWIDFDEPFFDGDAFADAEISPGVGVDGNLEYVPQGSGISNIDISGNELRYRVALSELSGADPVGVFFDAADFVENDFNTTAASTVNAPAMEPPPAPETNAVRLVDDSTGGQLSFRYRVDSEAGSDFLRVFLDGSMVVEESGDSGWQLFTQDVAPGQHTLRFEYNKDASGSAGVDAAWIDNVAMNEPDLIFQSGGETTPSGERVTCID